MSRHRPDSSRIEDETAAATGLLQVADVASADVASLQTGYERSARGCVPRNAEFSVIKSHVCRSASGCTIPCSDNSVSWRPNRHSDPTPSNTQQGRLAELFLKLAGNIFRVKLVIAARQISLTPWRRDDNLVTLCGDRTRMAALLVKKNIKTMEDFARAVGLSRPTVSKFFNNPSTVRAKTRAKIEAVLKTTRVSPQYFRGESESKAHQDHRPHHSRSDGSRFTSRLAAASK